MLSVRLVNLSEIMVANNIDKVMIRHTKYRCQININPHPIKRLPPGSRIPTLPTQGSQLEQSLILPTKFQEEYSNPESSEFVSEKIPYSPYNSKAQISLKQVSTEYYTKTEGGTSTFLSRQDLFESPPRYGRRSYLPSDDKLKGSGQDRLMDMTRACSKSIIMNQSVDEFSLDLGEREQKRGSSEEVQRLRKENAELRRLLSEDWSCSCKSPYIAQQVEYLRDAMLSHYSLCGGRK